MWGFLMGGAIGYALGSRAGGRRYDQVVRTCRKIVDHPAVQGAAGVASAKITALYPGGKDHEGPGSKAPGRRNAPALRRPSGRWR